MTAGDSKAEVLPKVRVTLFCYLGALLFHVESILNCCRPLLATIIHKFRPRSLEVATTWHIGLLTKQQPQSYDL